ncbi:MAG: 50S ribosomal protein L23 [bacterium]|nr:50S ribosomal protein L23 [bacterium]
MALFWQKGGKEVTVAKTERVTKKPVAKTAVKIPKKLDNKLSVKTEKKSENLAEKRSAAVTGGVTFPKGSAVIKPRVTEKAGMLAEKGVYTFEVLKSANSQQISAAIKEAYKVTPVKISIAPIKSKTMFARGKSGRTVSGKKAYVYLKKGEKIEFI